MSEEVPTATPYTVYVFDCPVCGGQTMIGDRDPDDTEECGDCDAVIMMVI